MLPRILVSRALQKLVSLCMLVFLIFFNSSASAEIQLTEKEKTWLKAHPVITIGIDNSYAPYSSQKAGVIYEGIVPDFLAYIEKNIDLKFEVIPDLTWAQIMESALERDLDVIATAVKTEEREKSFLFSDDYINTPMIIMKRHGNEDINSAVDIVGRRIALVRGYNSTNRVLADYPDIIPHYVKSPIEGLQAVAVGNADAYVGVLGVSVYVARENGLTNLVISSRYNQDQNGQGFAVRKDWPELVSILNKVLDAVPQKEKNRIVGHWIPILTARAENRSIPDPLEFSEQEKEWLRDHPVIRIGAMDAWPPMDYLDQEGNAQGIGLDFIKLFNTRLANNFKVVSGDWDKNLRNLRDGDLDAILDITPTGKRSELFSFTTPYLEVPHVIIAQKGTPYLESLDDLKGKKIVLEKGFFLEKMIAEELPGVKVISVQTTSDALDVLSKGGADAYVGNRAVATYIIRNELIENLAEHGKIRRTSSINAIGTLKSNTLLASIMQKLLDNITIVERRAITKDWVEDPQRTLLLTREERNWIKENPVVSVASDIDFPPIEYVDKDGNFQGLTVDYLNRISDILGIRFEADNKSTWSTSVQKVLNSELQMFSAAGVTPERKKMVTFTTPYLQLPMVIFALDSVPFVDGISGLIGKKVAVVKSYAVVDYLKSGNLGLDIVEVSSVEEGLKRVKSRDVDAYIGSILVTGHIIREKGFTHIRVAGETPYKNGISMAARHDLPILHSILQKALNTISSEERGRILRNWVGLQTAGKIDYTAFWQVGAAVIALLLAFFGWNAYLQRRVRQQVFESKALQEQLRHAQKMEAVGQLTGGIAHDFNNILAIVLGNLELLAEDKANDSAAIKKINTAISGAQRGADLTRKLLNFSREDTEGTKLVSANDFIANMKDFITKSLTVSIDVKFDFEKELWLLQADFGDLQDVLINLSLNARDSMPNGGTLTFKTRNRQLDAQYVKKHPQARTGKFVMISIIDTGSGMDEELKERIFEPFFTTKKIGEGTGLGLSMVYGFVKRSGGHIIVETEIGKGTEIQIYLRRARKRIVDTNPVPSMEIELPGGEETILIVDDEAQLLDIAQDNLKALGYKTLTAKNGKDAVEVLEKNTAIDLLFSDVVIPGGTDGFKLARKARALNKNLRILLTSGYSKEREEMISEDGDNANKLARNLLKKPYSRSELAVAIRQTMDSEV